MRAPQPEPPIPGSFATPSLLAWIVNGKYVMSLPLYRIETDLKACGATISRQDMANWMMNVHARWLAKVHERMKVELLSHVRIHADETTVQVLKEPNREAKKKSRMWLFCSARCNVPVYVFEYHETRRKGVAQEFLAGWSGTLTANGYKPYFNLGNPNIANTACLVHVRRYFAQIVKIAGGDAKAASAASVALEARRRIDAMFKVDSKFDDMEPGARKAARDAELRPLMEDFCLCSISCCGFSHDDFSGLGRACRPRNGLNWMVLVSPPERTGKDYDQHAPSTVYPSFAAERGIRRVDRAENTCQRADGA